MPPHLRLTADGGGLHHQGADGVHGPRRPGRWSTATSSSFRSPARTTPPSASTTTSAGRAKNRAEALAPLPCAHGSIPAETSGTTVPKSLNSSRRLAVVVAARIRLRRQRRGLKLDSQPRYRIHAKGAARCFVLMCVRRALRESLGQRRRPEPFYGRGEHGAGDARARVPDLEDLGARVGSVARRAASGGSRPHWRRRPDRAGSVHGGRVLEQPLAQCGVLRLGARASGAPIASDRLLRPRRSA